MAIATMLLIFLCILLAADIIISLNTHRDLKREIDQCKSLHEDLKRRVFSMGSDALHCRNDIDNTLADICIIKKKIEKLEAPKAEKAQTGSSFVVIADGTECKKVGRPKKKGKNEKSTRETKKA